MIINQRYQKKYKKFIKEYLKLNGLTVKNMNKSFIDLQNPIYICDCKNQLEVTKNTIGFFVLDVEVMFYIAICIKCKKVFLYDVLEFYVSTESDQYEV